MKNSSQELKFRDKIHGIGPSEYNPAETTKAWSKFLANRNAPSIPVMGVRPLIYQSWMRSNTTGVRPAQFAAPSLEKGVFDEKQRFYQSEMRRATQACLHNMNDMLAGTEAMLMLTDKDGVILETVGDKSTLSKGGKINLSVGGAWSETASGTNGIGTALWMDKPVHVHAEEHFCEGMKAWSCAAAPIHDPIDRSIIGVINLSGLTSIFHKHNAAFAAALARDIEVSLQQSLSQMNFTLLEWVVGRKPSRALSGNDGLAIINRFGRLVFGRYDEEPDVGSLSPEGLGKPFLDLSGSISEEAILAALPARFTCKDVQLIEFGGTVKGASLILRDNAASSGYISPTKRAPLPGIEIGNTGLKIVGRSEAILATLETAYSLLDTDAPTLIQGQTGVGKQLFARLIHAGVEPSKNRPFTPINCAALTKEMLEIGLASSDVFNSDNSLPESKSDGKFLVFDEIGDLPLELQPVLLRLLETLTSISHDASSERPPTRILSLTNRFLMDEVAADKFRRDLFYRLSAVVLEIPPLRDRGEDILLIFEHYNRLLSEQSGRGPLILGTAVEEALLAHDWPGNVRELCNSVSSMHYKPNAGRIEVSDLPFNQEGWDSNVLPSQTEQPAPVAIGSETLKDSEMAVIERALTSNNGNLSKTAIALGVSRPTLYRKMELHNISIVDGKLRKI
ncbi:MAG: sigma-54-dependent Fis family transcriptional regulator [Rhodobacteraceae bacterium]|nr:sigma-54-dependent Fis family transcriptional regulator [Paracoccaceae bacterium]